jgi:hypothetical protein
MSSSLYYYWNQLGKRGGGRGRGEPPPPPHAYPHLASCAGGVFNNLCKDDFTLVS